MDACGLRRLDSSVAVGCQVEPPSTVVWTRTQRGAVVQLSPPEVSTYWSEVSVAESERKRVSCD